MRNRPLTERRNDLQYFFFLFHVSCKQFMVIDVSQWAEAQYSLEQQWSTIVFKKRACSIRHSSNTSNCLRIDSIEDNPYTLAHIQVTYQTTKSNPE